MWGQGGWLRALGALDFAGGIVVHVTSGFAALAAALIMKKRIGLDEESIEPHDTPMVVLGTGLLWFGWFGFNAGSALASGGLATSAFVVTNTAAAMGALSWMTMNWWLKGKPSVIGTACGAVAGLAAVTPASGFVTPMAGAIIGLGAGVFCYLACHIKARSNFVDDSLDVVGVHGVGGVWGSLAMGLFGTLAVNAAGANGLFSGNPGQLIAQIIAIVATGLFAFVMTVLILKLIDAVFGLRVEASDEVRGLDITQHGEPAYSG
jgi:Amt family ammonium transporter